ncbi:putative fad dependent oxidoreductase superfamily protein [Eutypa lata UCREL1]|uniref:Putative fad dependent oxidoreductase superfamily protein n=1 Tax=Eutypa lata (strain UCR-EL1) TaxID=1287681 RepID=M7TI61_EUTLA|nr:putative fad dependent oxidoreductase superfamily protein [Eutypa lata UCREL1]
MAGKPQSKCLSPVANPVASFWTIPPHGLDDHRSTPDLPSVSDVVIIGAGFAGVATAYHLFKDNPNPPSVTLLEARKVCSGASGRNGGHVKPDTYFNVPKYTRLYGAKAAAELAAFEASHPYAVKTLVESEGLDCDFHLTRAVDVYLDPEHARVTEEAYRKLLNDGVVDLKDVAFTPKKDAERISGVKGAQCCFSFTAAHLWPLKMVQQLVEKLLEKGLNLQANTPVKSVSSTRNSQGLWTIETERGTIAAHKVVYATNGYTAQVLPEYTDRIVPVRGICSRIVTPRGPNSPHLVNTYGIRFDPSNNDYLIPRADGSIVVGGARQRFWHVRDQWFDNVRDDELVADAVSYFDGYMQRHFRGWEASDAKTDHVWTGIMGYSSDFLPHLGEVPDKPGQYIIAGFSGHGMPEILLSSKGVAAMVRNGISFEESGLPQIFKTSTERITNAKSPLEESLQPLWNGNDKAKL